MRTTAKAPQPRRLRRRLGWRWHRPARRAIERDERAIARWVEADWPRIRSTHHLPFWFLRLCGLSLW